MSILPNTKKNTRIVLCIVFVVALGYFLSQWNNSPHLIVEVRLVAAREFQNEFNENALPKGIVRRPLNTDNTLWEFRKGVLFFGDVRHVLVKLSGDFHEWDLQFQKKHENHEAVVVIID